MKKEFVLSLSQSYRHDLLDAIQLAEQGMLSPSQQAYCFEEIEDTNSINGKGCTCLLQVAEYENFVRKRITQLRHRLHVSEHKMSLDLGKSGSYMRSISIGKAMPSMHEFLRICEYLGVTPQEFFTGAGDETDRINIFNRLQDLDDGDIQKLQTFLDWMEEK